jgi:SseB protein C-terminal domain
MLYTSKWMKWTNPFASRRPTQELNAPVLVFVGEQDGPSEKMLKGKLSEIFGEHKNVQKAYLARAHYGDPKVVSVCLCLGVTGGADRPLVEAVHSLFAKYFNRAVHLDILFLTPEKEALLVGVCNTFYQCY